MQIHRNGLLFRVGYMFVPKSQEPKTVDRCTLVTRFALMLTPWVFCNLLAWLLLGFVFGILAQIIWRVLVFLGPGHKLVYDSPPEEEYLWEWLVGRHALCALFILGYRREDVRFLKLMREATGFTQSPLILFVSVVMVLVIGTLLVANLPDLFWGIVWIVSRIGLVGYNTIGWWGTAIVAVLSVVAAVYLARVVRRKTLATESGKVLASYVSEWKSAHCPIYQVVT